MGNSWFRFKQFKIEQAGAAMKVGTDGVLVGAWSFIPASGHILDIGSGTGLIALMAAQRSIDATIDAIEIEESAFLQCKENIENSPWPTRCNVIQGSIFDYYPEKRYNCILCNPPFFIQSLKNPGQERTLARHCTNGFDHKALLDHVMTNLLDKDGLFSLILPVTEARTLITYAQNCNIGISRITHILSFPNEAPIRYLMEFTHNRPHLTNENDFILYDSKNIRSTEYNKLMEDFYL